MLHYLISSPNLHPSQSCSSTPLSLLCYPILPHSTLVTSFSSHTTLFTPLSLTLLFSLNSPSHLSFNTIFSHTTLFTPLSLTPLFSPHSSSHHYFHPILPHTTLFTPFSLTLFTPFFLTPFFLLHSP